MAFRLLRYAVAAMQRHLEAGHKKLPLVIPVLFYTGKRSPYPYSTRWLDEFDDPALAGKLYTEVTFLGSQEECIRICADNAILMTHFEANRIIA